MDDLQKTEKISLLMDFYGPLLSEKQRDFLRLYNEENYSLQEIAEEYGVSRQGVYDAVSKAQKALAGYETKLGFLAEYEQRRDAASALIEKHSGDAELCEALRRLI